MAWRVSCVRVPTTGWAGPGIFLAKVSSSFIFHYHPQVSECKQQNLATLVPFFFPSLLDCLS